MSEENKIDYWEKKRIEEDAIAVSFAREMNNLGWTKEEKGKILDLLLESEKSTLVDAINSILISKSRLRDEMEDLIENRRL